MTSAYDQYPGTAHLPLNRELRRLVRLKAGAPSWVPVVIVKGRKYPTLVGERHYYATRTGQTIHHPNAYRKTGWSSAIYHPSTIRVEVGDGWLAKRVDAIAEALAHHALDS